MVKISKDNYIHSSTVVKTPVYIHPQLFICILPTNFVTLPYGLYKIASWRPGQVARLAEVSSWTPEGLGLDSGQGTSRSGGFDL